LRAAEAALPASDRVVLRAMGDLPGGPGGRVVGAGATVHTGAPLRSEGIARDRLTQSRLACRIPGGACTEPSRAERTTAFSPAGVGTPNGRHPQVPTVRERVREAGSQASSSPRTERRRLGWAKAPAS
jgi:hypothetical protein